MTVCSGHNNKNCEFLRVRDRFEEGIGNSEFVFGHFETDVPMEHPCGDLWEPQEMQAWISRGKTERKPESMRKMAG